MPNLKYFSRHFLNSKIWSGGGTCPIFKRSHAKQLLSRRIFVFAQILGDQKIPALGKIWSSTKLTWRGTPLSSGKGGISGCSNVFVWCTVPLCSNYFEVHIFAISKKLAHLVGFLAGHNEFVLSNYFCGAQFVPSAHPVSCGAHANVSSLQRINLHPVSWYSTVLYRDQNSQ